MQAFGNDRQEFETLVAQALIQAQAHSQALLLSAAGTFGGPQSSTELDLPVYSQELEPAAPVCEPQLSQLLRRFLNVREVNPDENVRMPLRVTDDTLPALLVGHLTFL